MVIAIFSHRALDMVEAGLFKIRVGHDGEDKSWRVKCGTEQKRTQKAASYSERETGNQSLDRWNAEEQGLTRGQKGLFIALLTHELIREAEHDNENWAGC
jgi:hypothetical protein